MHDSSEDSVRPTSRPISVVIVDDHPLFREAIARLLDESPEFSIVGEAGDGEAAIELVSLLQPRVVILDITLPKMSGIEATRRLKEDYPDIAIVVLSVHDDAKHASAALAAGANGYLTKDLQRGEIVRALREVVAGRLFICEGTLRQIVSMSALNHDVPPSACDECLTRRELQIMRLLVQGMSNRDIAKELNLSTATVKGHVESIYSRLKVGSRTEAVTTALRLGIVDLGDV